MPTTTTTPANPPPSDEQIGVLKRQLLKKGAEINEKLVALLNGQKVNVEDLMSAKPGETPIERLRRFMAIVEGALARIRDGSYGRCARCGDGLPVAHLQQILWIDTCQACAVLAAADGT